MGKYREIHKLRELPVIQNRMFSTKEEAVNCQKGDVDLVQDLETGLVFNRAFDPGLTRYSSEYQNEQAFSGFFRNHLADVARVIKKYGAGRSIIEVGCGKGYFLEYLQKSGYKIIGFDPTYEGSNQAIVKSVFDRTVVARAECIVLRHVLEHVADPVNFLSMILDINGGKGDVYIEVPCLDWISAHRAWFDIFYEHVNYFRLSDLYRIFGTVYESGYSFGGQYVYIVADLATLKNPKMNNADTFLLPTDFTSSIDNFAKVAIQRKSVVWGGSSKGVIFSLYMQRAGARLDFAIDINPGKQKMFMPGSGSEVLSPEEGMKIFGSGDNVFVMNSNYIQEVMLLIGDAFNYVKVA